MAAVPVEELSQWLPGGAGGLAEIGGRRRRCLTVNKLWTN